MVDLLLVRGLVVVLWSVLVQAGSSGSGKLWWNYFLAELYGHFLATMTAKCSRTLLGFVAGDEGY